MSTEIEELTKLVEEEKNAEDKIRQARNEAEETVKRAREEANRKMLETQTSLSSSSQPQTYGNKEFDEEKNKITRAHQDRINTLNKLAERNLKRAVQMIIEEIMRVKP